jgi:hypothetical protein
MKSMAKIYIRFVLFDCNSENNIFKNIAKLGKTKQYEEFKSK